MLKVLVIDDERLVRQMVIRCVDWESIGLKVVGEASSARMGREMIDEIRPDIVFMDIKMPGMDGLSCSRMILEKHPHIKILILSGHDEFEYASESIRVGIFDYLLKPINAEEIQNAAVKARDAIMTERNFQKETAHYKEELEKHAGYIKDRQLSELIRGNVSGQSLESLSYFGISLETPVYQTALVISDGLTEALREEEKILNKMHMRDLIEDFYSEFPGVITTDSGADYLVILNNESDTSIYDSAVELRHYLEDNTESRICIAAGNVYHELNQLHESYQESKDALKYRFVYGEDGIIFFRDIFPYYDAEKYAGNKEEQIHGFGYAIRIGDTAGTEKILEEILDYFKKTGGEREQILILSIKLFAEILRVLAELKIDIMTEDFTYSSVLEGLLAQETFESMELYLKCIAEKACMMAKTEVSCKEKSLIDKVKEYMEEHLAEETLSLSVVARNFYVNPSYLSRIFKEKTGNTFSGFLFTARMGEAEKMILNTDLKSYEIAELVGISDPHYFSTCFKKHTGLSVAEYKRRNK